MKKYLKAVAFIILITTIFLLAGCRQEKETTKKNLTQSNSVSQSQEQKIRYVIENGITFSHASGVYAGPELKVHMKAPAGYTIAFTTNGTKPSGKDASGKSELDVPLNRSMSGYLIDHRELMLCPEFSDLILLLLKDESLPAGVVLNTALVDSKGTVGNDIQTNVYFLNVDFAKRFPGCLVVSVITDQNNLLDYNSGILAAGAVYDAWKKTDAGKKIIAEKEWWKLNTNSTQKGKKWEKPCRIQLFKPGSKTPDVELNAGLRLRGGTSRRFYQKSLNFILREEYGDNLLSFPLFDKRSEYKSFSLRNGGNDTDTL